jgi:pyruvate carboxylase
VRTVFFELTGQPRSVKIRDRSVVTVKQPRRKAEVSNGNHVAASMSGTSATLKRNQMTIEAMAMEPSVRSGRGCVVDAVLATPGEAVDSKDLLIVLT